MEKLFSINANKELPKGKLGFSVELAVKTCPLTATAYIIFLENASKGYFLYVPGAYPMAHPYLPRRRLNDALRELSELGLVELVNDPFKKAKFIARLNGAYGMMGIVKCEWCHTNSYTLDQYHFPIPRKEGGTEVVSICPNCHALYHRGDLYKINEEVKL